MCCIHVIRHYSGVTLVSLLLLLLPAMNLLQLVTSQQSEKLERLAKKSPPVCVAASPLPGNGGDNNRKGQQQQPQCPAGFRDEDLRSRLTPVQYEVTQLRGTEKRFSGKYLREKSPGVYECVVCGQELFASGHKFDSGCGWPAFYDVAQDGKIAMVKDTSHGMMRYEIRCANCGAHLGHVFDDGPKPTGLRYCVNSAALNFAPASSADAATATATSSQVDAKPEQLRQQSETGTARTDL